MKVKNIQLSNFRGLAEIDIKFNGQVNVIVGNNGYGKSTILDALAVLLSRLIGRIRSSKGTGRFFDVKDIKYGKSETVNEISVEVCKQIVNWRITKSKHRKHKQSITNLSELRNVVASLHDKLDEDSDFNLPLAVYYSVNRAVLDVPLRISKRHEFDQLSAYDQALTGARNDFRIFFEWYRKQEDYENEQRLYPVEGAEEDLGLLGSLEYRDPQLQAVRTAISNLTGFTNIRIKRNPLRMEAKKGNNYFDIKQLSDGEKCLLAMVGDLARRLAIANPGMEDPLNGEGVVLIDEVDLHLHPKWQRLVIPALTKTFPECQFIVSTHSPQILSHVKPESIIVLKNTNGEITQHTVNDSYGKNSDRILEDIMDETARPKDIKDDLREIFKLIQKGKIKKAQSKIVSLRQEIGEDSELIKAEVLIKRREIIGK